MAAMRTPITRLAASVEYLFGHLLRSVDGATAAQEMSVSMLGQPFGARQMALPGTVCA
jgi:hypothetical protein